MNSDLILLAVKITAALGVVISVIYLGVQIHQQNEINKAQFGHSLTQRMYERYFHTAKDKEFSTFLATDWAQDNLDDTDKWRIAIFVNMVLVDISDAYEKVQKGFVDKEHLDMRIHMLKLGTMKAPIARRLWDYWKDTRSIEFIEWFEKEIYGDDELSTEDFGKSALPNLRR